MFRSQFLPVFVAVFHPVHPFIQPLLHPGGIFGDLIPFQIEGVVTVIITLGVGGMTGKGNVADRIDDETGDEGAVGVGADHCLIDNFFGGDDDVLGSKSGFLLLTDDAPDLGVAVGIAALHVDDGHIREQRGTTITSFPV